MSSKIKNIIILVVVAIVLVFVYFYFFGNKKEQPLLNAPSGSNALGSTASGDTSTISQELLSVLLNIKNIKIDSSIFSSPVFSSLRDSSIVLTPDGQEGRPNPFAPIGSDQVVNNDAGNLNQGTETNINPLGEQVNPDILSNGSTNDTTLNNNTASPVDKKATSSKTPKIN